MTVLQAPIDLAAPTHVGPRVYRKQVLAKRTINYPMPDGESRTVTFDDEYLTDLAQAFNDGAYDLVPFQLADGANKHNEDPRNYGGRVIGAEVTGDGLDVILELSADTAELVEKTGRRLGVSPRIKEALEHVDGRTFKRAIRHVLGTLDGRQAGLREWQPVIDLSTEADPEVVDLTGFTDQEGAPMGPRIIDLSALDDEQREALESFAIMDGIDLAAAEVDPDDEPHMGGDDDSDDDDGEHLERGENDDDGEPAGDQGDPDDDGEGDEGDEGDDAGSDDEPVSDAELEALIDAELEASGVDLSNMSDEDVLDMAAAEHGTDGDERTADRREAAELRFQVAAGDYRRRGVPPHIIDLAEPVLALSDDDANTLDLASPATGESIDVRGIVRDMLDAVAGTIDLSGEAGYGHETEPTETRDQLAGDWIDYLENN